jgi:hypothetical protein
MASEVWVPSKGDKVRIVGVHGFDNEKGEIVDLTGSGLLRVSLFSRSLIVGAAANQVRQLSDEEAKSVEAALPEPFAGLVEAFAKKARSSKGGTKSAWEQAAELVAAAAKSAKS